MNTHCDRPDISAALDYWPSPPPWGWTADDLDALPADGPNGELDFFKRVELISGALVFGAPQTAFHERVSTGIASRLSVQSPNPGTVAIRMDVRLGDRTRFCPDILRE